MRLFHLCLHGLLNSALQTGGMATLVAMPVFFPELVKPMDHKALYVTNNPLVLAKAKRDDVRGAADFADVLNMARNLVHKGHKLKSHPLSGSIKPGETPYKTVVLTKECGELDLDSLRIIEDAITLAAGLLKQEKRHSDEALADLRMIDYGLVFGRLS